MTKGKGAIARLGLLSALMLGGAPYAYATASGFDTPTGVTDIPIAIQGTTAIDVSAAGITIPGASGPLNPTALSALISLVNLAPCGMSGYIVKTNKTTYSCAFY